MSNHLYKKYIVNYEIKGQHKMLTKICKYPVNIYNNLSSDNYNNTPSLFIRGYYNKANYYYLIVFDEIIHMGSDIVIGLVSELIRPIKKNQINEKEINKNDMINNLFNSMIKIIPNIQDSKDGHTVSKKLEHDCSDTNACDMVQKISSLELGSKRQSLENKNLLNMIKKENKIGVPDLINTKRIDESDTESDEDNYFNLLDNMDFDNMDEDKLYDLNAKLVSVKNSLINGINGINGPLEK